MTTYILLTPKQAIFHSAEFLKTNTIVVVQGTIVLLDLERNRLDIAEDGGKLIVRVATESIDTTLLTNDDRLQVTGTLKKEQRRTFLDANNIRRLATTTGGAKCAESGVTTSSSTPRNSRPQEQLGECDLRGDSNISL